MENQGILKLTKPVKVNGQERTEILYDFDALVVDDIITLDKGRSAAGLSSAATQELDAYAQFAVFMRAAMRADAAWDESDIKRMNATDALRAKRLGRDFFFASADEEDSEVTPEETSAASLET